MQVRQPPGTLHGPAGFRRRESVPLSLSRRSSLGILRSVLATAAMLGLLLHGTAVLMPSVAHGCALEISGSPASPSHAEIHGKHRDHPPDDVHGLHTGRHLGGGSRLARLASQSPERALGSADVRDDEPSCEPHGGHAQGSCCEAACSSTLLLPAANQAAATPAKAVERPDIIRFRSGADLEGIYRPPKSGA